MNSIPAWGSYWTQAEVQVNFYVFLNLLGAMFLGLVVGYERSYHGRAAGMRTYGLVCMASAALTVIFGYGQFWYGGTPGLVSTADPSRVIQGVVTGIGFLGAGVIMKDGLNISGLTTAASLWASSAIGILFGIGFYSAAILLALLSASSMLWGSRLERKLPSREAIAVVVRFKENIEPKEEILIKVAKERGYDIARGSIAVHFSAGQQQWSFIAVMQGRGKGHPITALADELAKFDGVDTFHLTHAHN